MKILVDVDALEKDGVLTPALAEKLRIHAVRHTGSAAINLLLAFGVIAVVAGAIALMPTPTVGAVFGFGFTFFGWLISEQYHAQWRQLGSIWMVVGGVLLASSVALLIEQPVVSPLAMTAILAVVAVMAQSRILIAVTPFTLISAIGGSTGYWHASYSITVEEPLITIVLFSALAFGGWELSKSINDVRNDLALSFTRMCVILVNFGFWVGSLWGDTPGKLWRGGGNHGWMSGSQEIPPLSFVLAWALALLFAGAWGAKNGRRFMVNTVAVFGAIEFYTEWFEHIGAYPFSVMVAGVMTIMFGLGLWRYNRAQIT